MNHFVKQIKCSEYLYIYILDFSRMGNICFSSKKDNSVLQKNKTSYFISLLHSVLLRLVPVCGPGKTAAKTTVRMHCTHHWGSEPGLACCLLCFSFLCSYPGEPRGWISSPR